MVFKLTNILNSGPDTVLSREGLRFLKSQFSLLKDQLGVNKSKYFLEAITSILDDFEKAQIQPELQILENAIVVFPTRGKFGNWSIKLGRNNCNDPFKIQLITPSCDKLRYGEVHGVSKKGTKQGKYMSSIDGQIMRLYGMLLSGDEKAKCTIESLQSEFLELQSKPRRAVTFEAARL